MLKSRLGKLLPYPLIERSRKIVHLGPRRCQVCDSRIRRFHNSGYGYPVLEQLRVVGGMTRRADRCPICHSTSRERLIWFWLSEGGRGFRLPKNTRAAHFAPEKGLSRKLRAVAPSYTAYDFDPSRYRHLSDVRPADLNGLDIPSESFDLVLCNHVIEHVPDVGVALGELSRILVRGGTAILQVPIALKLDETRELGTESSPEARIAELGQDDHLRLFDSAGYLEALERAGFEVERYDPFEDDRVLATEWMLDPLEVLLLCRRPHNSPR